jgi:mannose-6-phosphate isomerase class I
LGRTDDKARAALRGDEHVLDELASSLIRVERDNLVERPWGGGWIERFKQIEAGEAGAGLPWGEAFEISAFAADEEAGRYPSRFRFDDGSQIDLPTLLEAQAGKLLGPAFTARYGSAFPLLPKTLNIKELLSVQGHPPGHTEVYIIIDAEPGATLRLGFNRDIDPSVFTRELAAGMEHQDRLLELLGSGTDAQAVHRIVAPWLAQRDANANAIVGSLATCAAPGSADLTEAASVLKELKALYWRVLDSMNAIPVEPGQVIHNATPQRLLETGGGKASAEVHALGNPDRREILALEIRRPGPTFRAWDNVRFPRRAVDVTAAVAALNLRATSPEEFLVERRPVPGREGVFVSVDCDYFGVEHLMPDRTLAVNVPASPPHSLHCLAGAVDVSDARGRRIGHLERGESALVPAGVGAYVVESAEAAEVVRVTLPVC